MVPVDRDGKIDFYNGSTGTTQLVADVFGYYLIGAQLTWTSPNNIGLAQAYYGTVINAASCPSSSAPVPSAGALRSRD